MTRLILYSYQIVNVSLGFLASLLPTFYPLEAESRGARPFEYGFVFGVVSLSRGLLSPISGALAVKFGIKKTICVGAIVESLCGIFFAFLSVSHDVAYFIGFSCLFRFIEGFAGAFRNCSSYGILMEIYPEKVN